MLEPDGARYRLVILDFDGTLADSAPWFARVLNDVARRFRFRTIDRAEMDRMRGDSPGAMLRRLEVPRWKLPFVARHMRGLMARDLAEIVLFPGIGDLVETLHAAGVTIAVVTSNADSNVRGVLGPLLAARIDRFDCGSAFLGKARIIRRLVAQSGVSPARVLAIGDEIRDIDAAEAAGVAAGAVTWGYADAEALRARRPAFLFTSVDEIAAAVLPGGAGVAPTDALD